MASVGKTAEGTKHINKMVLRKVVVHFQRYPGTAGSDADRAIADVPYTLKVAGKVTASGKTAADGTVTLNIPAGVKAIIEIFDTEYVIKLVGALEPITKLKGQQRRLQLLGYELGNVDGEEGPNTDRATLMFQADNALDTNGITGQLTTTNQLKTQFGE